MVPRGLELPAAEAVSRDSAVDEVSPFAVGEESGLDPSVLGSGPKEGACARKQKRKQETVQASRRRVSL